MSSAILKYSLIYCWVLPFMYFKFESILSKYLVDSEIKKDEIRKNYRPNLIF